MKFKKAFVKWVEERGIKWVFIAEKAGIPYTSLMLWKTEDQPLADRHLEALWIFTGKSIIEPTYKIPLRTFVYPEKRT